LLFKKEVSMADMANGKNSGIGHILADNSPNCPECGSPLIPTKTGEVAPLHPVSVYGNTKKTQEELCTVFSRTFKIPTLILRYFNVYGPGQCLTNPYTGIAIVFYSRMDHNGPVDIYEDGAMLRDFVHVRDVVQANLKVLALKEPGVNVMNIGSGQAVSLFERNSRGRKKKNKSSRKSRFWNRLIIRKKRMTLKGIINIVFLSFMFGRKNFLRGWMIK